ncbi:hypothetical protein ABZ897_19400 [Nonomuraea sp. NPDC046802]|uniref:hypothetical protein n=1 Tax=Nonomuraea sp. NPDC046802 TaxID=3154919 RepID=UPI0033C70CB0
MVVKPAAGKRCTRIVLPTGHTITLPPPEHLVFYTVLVAMGALEIVEWPIVGIIGIGHLLASQHRFPTLQQAGEAVQAA